MKQIRFQSPQYFEQWQWSWAMSSALCSVTLLHKTGRAPRAISGLIVFTVVHILLLIGFLENKHAGLWTPEPLLLARRRILFRNTCKHIARTANAITALFWRMTMDVDIVVLKCQKCNQCLNVLFDCSLRLFSKFRNSGIPEPSSFPKYDCLRLILLCDQ